MSLRQQSTKLLIIIGLFFYSFFQDVHDDLIYILLPGIVLGIPLFFVCLWHMTSDRPSKSSFPTPQLMNPPTHPSKKLLMGPSNYSYSRDPPPSSTHDNWLIILPTPYSRQLIRNPYTQHLVNIYKGHGLRF